MDDNRDGKESKGAVELNEAAETKAAPEQVLNTVKDLKEVSDDSGTAEPPDSIVQMGPVEENEAKYSESTVDSHPTVGDAPTPAADTTKSDITGVTNSQPPGYSASETADVAPGVTIPVEPKRDPNLVSITLRPADKGWVMGEDWVVDFHNLTSIVGIREYVEKLRGISRHRIQIRLKGKVLPPNREIWTLRRLGIYDGYMMLVEPTLSGAWLWEPQQYYIDKLIREVSAIVESSVAGTVHGRISLTNLNAKIKPPPCIKCSLRVFLRQYPEHFYIHTDTTDNTLWVHLSKRLYHMPTFSNLSVEIGTFQYFKPKRFDWNAYKEIDDMYKVESLPPGESQCCIMQCYVAVFVMGSSLSVHLHHPRTVLIMYRGGRGGESSRPRHRHRRGRR